MVSLCQAFIMWPSEIWRGRSYSFPHWRTRRKRRRKKKCHVIGIPSQFPVPVFNLSSPRKLAPCVWLSGFLWLWLSCWVSPAHLLWIWIKVPPLLGFKWSTFIAIALRICLVWRFQVTPYFVSWGLHASSHWLVKNVTVAHSPQSLFLGKGCLEKLKPKSLHHAFIKL